MSKIDVTHSGELAPAPCELFPCGFFDGFTTKDRAAHAGAASCPRAGPARRPWPALRAGCRAPPCALLRYRCSTWSRTKTRYRSSTTCSSTSTTSTGCTTSWKGQVSKQRYLPRLRTSTLLLLALLPPRAHLLLSQLQRLNACLRLLLPGCHAGCIVVLACCGPPLCRRAAAAA